MRIDFVSDVACPWCAVGLHGLERALAELRGTLEAELQFQPFELNPGLGPEGRDLGEYLAERYGATPESMARTQATLRERGAAVGFAFGPRTRVWNTFDSHRLLHWAALQGRQRELKHALLAAYHGQGRNPSARHVLLDTARQAGLDVDAAAAVLDQGCHAAEVRSAQQLWRERGIHAVPSVVVGHRHLIQGGQPPAAYAQALRRIAADPGHSDQR